MDLHSGLLRVNHMKAVIQQEKSGCAIASSAALAGISYNQAKKVANSLGIFAGDKKLWSDTLPIRKLLKQLNIKTGIKEQPFQRWDSLPDCALLSIKWHKENGKAFWHWVVFVRDNDQAYVLDSKKSLESNIRTDFGRMKPKWFIAVDAKKE